MFAKRLKQLRLARGLTLHALSFQIGGIVTKQALSKYESGKIMPSPVVMKRLAQVLGVKAAHLLSEPKISVRFVAYRKLSGLIKRDRARLESLISHELEQRTQLLEKVDKLQPIDIPVEKMGIRNLNDTETVAEKIRSRWCLGTDPIANLMGIIEDQLIHIMEIPADNKFDGLSAVATDEDDRTVAAAIVTRAGLCGERQRLNIAHELGHLILKIPKSVDEEKAAFRFGSAFLAPASTIFQNVGTNRDLLQIDELLLLKKRFGISIQAILYRLRDLKIINDQYYRQWCITINRSGWRRREPGEMEPEKPQWLLQTVLHALSEGFITHDQAEKYLGSTLQADVPLPSIDRRAFLKLPLEQRRKVIVDQASRLVNYYSKASDIRDLPPGEIFEYEGSES